MPLIFEHLNFVFTAISFAFAFKAITMIDLLYHYSPLNTTKGRFVGSLSKTKFDTPFLIKAWIKSNPLVSLPFSIVTFILVFSYLTYVIERSNNYAPCYEEDR